MRLEEKIAKALMTGQKTLSVAESCTGGLLTHRLTNISGSSGFLMATVVSYSNASKIKILKVPSSLIKKHGAVSLPVAKSMAQGVRRLLNTDFGVSITGIAGPTGGTPQKPVGLTFIGIASRQKTICDQVIFKGSRLRVKEQAADRALELLKKFLP
jgi:nicotinamide-nucleotide amidase